MDSNKPRSAAVEALFWWKVKAVNTYDHQRQIQAFPRSVGKRREVKKAYVTLEEGIHYPT